MSTKKIIAAIITMIMFIIGAGMVETMPIVTLMLIIGMGLTVKVGQLDK